MKDYHSMNADQMSAELREMAELAPTPDLQECYQRAAALLGGAQGARITDDQIKYMVDRFLGWTLPSDFNPDGGISFTPPKPSCFYMPIGTNLFDVFQAEAMVRYMIDGMPFPAIQEYVSEMCQSIDHMKVTPTQKEFAKAVLRAAIEFANARHGMHASQNAKAAAPSSTVRGGV